MSDTEADSERLKLKEHSNVSPGAAEEGAANSPKGGEELEEKPHRCWSVFWFALLPVVTIVLSIALIVVGRRHLKDCRKERFIPIFMIVQGSFSLVYSMLGVVQHILDRRAEKKEGVPIIRILAKGLTQLIGVFLLAWFIAGNVWVFRVHGKVNFKDVASPDYCHQTTYNFAFWYLIVSYIMALICIPLCVVLCCCAGIAASWRGASKS